MDQSNKDELTPPPIDGTEWKMQKPTGKPLIMNESDNFFDQLARDKEERKIKWMKRAAWLCFILGFLMMWKGFRG